MGLEKGYAQELVNFWVGSPLLGALQAILLLIVWIHGCLGIHFWLRLKPFYPRVKGLMLSFAVLLPALALLGYYQGGERILEAVQDPAWLARTFSPEHVGDPGSERGSSGRAHGDARFPRSGARRHALRPAFRQWRERRVGSIRLTYPDRTIRVARGFSVLEASLINSIPHAHVCGGRGRCSTCRIRILGDVTGLPVPSAAEQAVLERVHAAPGVRLACQLRPTSDITLVPMLSPYATAVDAYRTGARLFGCRALCRHHVRRHARIEPSGREAPALRHRVHHQPFLNAVSSAVLSAGGEPNQVLGDGLLALFGMSGPPDVACRQAIAASAAIAARVESLNSALAHALVEPIRFGIGIHAGVTIAGAIGYERHAQFTVIGDPVNVAARLEALTKTLACEVLMSEEVYERAGFGPDDLPAHEVEARGREESVKVRSVKRAADLARLIPEEARAVLTLTPAVPLASRRRRFGRCLARASAAS